MLPWDRMPPQAQTQLGDGAADVASEQMKGQPQGQPPQHDYNAPQNQPESSVLSEATLPRPSEAGGGGGGGDGGAEAAMQRVAELLWLLPLVGRRGATAGEPPPPPWPEDLPHLDDGHIAAQRAWDAFLGALLVRSILPLYCFTYGLTAIIYFA